MVGRNQHRARRRASTRYGRVVVSLPLWAVFVVSFGSPALAFFGVLLAQWLGRKSAGELETRSKREETMRTLRWAAELAVDQDDAGKAALGVSQLTALGESDLLDDAQRLFVDAAMEAVLEDAVEELEEAGEDAEVIRALGMADEHDVASSEQLQAEERDD